MPKCGYCDNDCSPTAKVCPKCGDDLGAIDRPWKDFDGSETLFDKGLKIIMIGGAILFFFVTLLFARF